MAALKLVPKFAAVKSLLEKANTEGPATRTVLAWDDKNKELHGAPKSAPVEVGIERFSATCSLLCHSVSRLQRFETHVRTLVDAERCSSWPLIPLGMEFSIRCPCRGIRSIRRSLGSRGTRRIPRLRHERPLGHEDANTAGPWICSISGWKS